jgi:hypothetical protein
MAKKTNTAAPTADVEMVQKPGLGIDEGIVLTTFFLLLGAIALVYVANQAYTGAAG